MVLGRRKTLGVVEEGLARRLASEISVFSEVSRQTSAEPALSARVSSEERLEQGGGWSTGVGPAGGDAEASRELTEGSGRVATSVTEHLAMVEQQADGVSQQADHGQDHQRLALMRGGLL